MQNGGGVERHGEALAVGLAQRGHEVTVCVRSRFLQGKRRHFRGVRLVPIPSIPTKNLDAITYTFFASLYALFCDVDIIHYHGVGPSTLAWIPRIFHPQARIVVTFHSQDKFHKKWGWFARHYLGWGEWTACKFPHATITVSQTIQKYCKNKFNKNVSYIPNGVAIEKCVGSDQLKKFGLEKNGYILTVARLIKHKGIHYLISAYKKIKTDKKLVIVGAPSYTDDYFAYLTGLAKQNPNIIFTGFQKGKILMQLFCNAYLYVHPSESEGLSLTILEAMGYGKCVLISNIPENLETIDHSGIAFENCDTIDLRQKLVKLLKDPALVQKKGNSALQFIREHFTWEKIINQTENLYKLLCSGSPVV